MSEQQPTEEELRAAMEAELSSIHVGDVIAQTIVSLINLGARRGGLAGGDPAEIDPGQLALAIEASRRLLPLVDEALGEGSGQIKEALSQLQLQFAKIAPTGAAVGEGDHEGHDHDHAGHDHSHEPAAPKPPENDAKSKLWVPGR